MKISKDYAWTKDLGRSLADGSYLYHYFGIAFVLFQRLFQQGLLAFHSCYLVARQTKRAGRYVVLMMIRLHLKNCSLVSSFRMAKSLFNQNYHLQISSLSEQSSDEPSDVCADFVVAVATIEALQYFLLRFALFIFGKGLSKSRHVMFLV